jgi:small subunit ribosomal protein S9
MEEQSYFYGTGKRKTSIARVRLIPGEGSIIVNNVPYEERFPRPEHRRVIQQPLLVTESVGKFNVLVKVEGGGVSGQAGAISHGIARALVGLLTRDRRVKERKKVGLRRARKAPQYTKR